MLTAGITILFIVLGFISFVLWKKAIGTLNLLSYQPYHYLFYVQLMIMSCFGASLMAAGVRIHHGVSNISDNNIFFITLFMTWYVTIVIPISMSFLNRFLKVDPVHLSKMYHMIPNKPLLAYCDIATTHLFFFLTIASIAVAIYVLKDAPILNAFMGDSDTFKLLTDRYSYKFAYRGSELVRNIIGESIVPMLSYVSFSYYLFRKNTSWAIIFFLQFLCALMFSAASLAKAGAVVYFLGLISVYVYSRGVLNRKKVFFILILLLMIMAGAYRLSKFYSDQDINTDYILDRGPIGRIVFGQITGLPNYLMIFPRLHPFLLGTDLSFRRFLGLEVTQAARIAMEYSNPDGVRYGTAGVMNTLFIGAAYSNFGWIGALISPVWVGILLGAIYVIFLRMKKNPLCIGWGSYTMNLLATGITGGFFSEFVFNTRIVGVSLAAILVLLGANILRKVIFR